MQPFGLFSLLQTLMDSTSKPNNPDTQNPTDSVVDTPSEAYPESEPNPSPANQEAILAFFDAHDNRIKRVKKRW